MSSSEFFIVQKGVNSGLNQSIVEMMSECFAGIFSSEAQEHVMVPEQS